MAVVRYLVGDVDVAIAFYTGQIVLEDTDGNPVELFEAGR